MCMKQASAGELMLSELFTTRTTTTTTTTANTISLQPSPCPPLMQTQATSLCHAHSEPFTTTVVLNTCHISLPCTL